jgi:hypothetical protein
MKQYRLLCLLRLSLAALFSSAASFEQPWPDIPQCDVFIAGGSTAALATAITSAETSPSLSICLTEPTDWVGGQMTSSGVSAFDFGTYNRKSENQPQSFRDLVSFLTAKGQRRQPACWVSTLCYNPATMVQQWVKERFSKSPNLHVLDHSVIKATSTARQFKSSSTASSVNDQPQSTISQVHLIQRRAKAGVDEWATLLSEQLEDWYSPVSSPMFDKRWINISASVFVDATEFGDLILTADLAVAQGVEAPLESSDPGSMDLCGQASTITFFMELLEKPPSTPDPAPPGGTAGGYPFSSSGCCCPPTDAPLDVNEQNTNSVTEENINYQSSEVNGKGDTAGECDYRGIWSYRRAFAGGNTHLLPPSLNSVNTGDVSQQNWGNPSGNDLDNGYLFLPLEQARMQVEKGTWAGGVNMTVISMLEQRAYGWFHFYADSFPEQYKGRLILNRNFPGTTTGLSKMPYLRDSRRGVGLDGFRLMHANETSTDGSHTGVFFQDAVAFGNYPADDHSINTCHPPSYMGSATTVPFYIPFRALTHQDASNLLLAGKTMSQTFYANSASRLHPAEWSSGVAAGAAASLIAACHAQTMSKLLQDATGQLDFVQSDEHCKTTAGILGYHITDLQQLLNSSRVGAPLTWTL